MSEGVADVARDLRALVAKTTPRLHAIGEEESRQARAPGKWSRREVLGHVIDSALNNVHRFVRAPQSDGLTFPDYDQPAWVAAGGYKEREWGSLVALWAGLNDHLASVIDKIPADRLAVECRIGKDAPHSLEFIVRDYPVHLRHHLEQILDPAASLAKSHPPTVA